MQLIAGVLQRSLILGLRFVCAAGGGAAGRGPASAPFAVSLAGGSAAAAARLVSGTSDSAMMSAAPSAA